MDVHVTALVPPSMFRSEWEDRTYAARAFAKFIEEAWANDLTPLLHLGVNTKIRVDVGANDTKYFTPEVKIEPYTPEIFDMMQKTREMLTDIDSIYSQFSNSPEGIRLFSG